ncbi:MAG: histidine phosphatase family protein, partial [Ferroplasma sp.]
MIIYVVRHGETFNNVEKIFPYTDTELTEHGREQALNLSKFLKPLKFDAIYSSPYIRVRQTTELITHQNYKTDGR